jgi:5-formyltetrahydrofolate cyclo-ligase
VVGDAAVSSEFAARKQQLRATVLAARREMSETDRAAAGRALRDAVLEDPPAQMAGTIAAYVSVGTEPATRALLFALWKRGSYVILQLLKPDGDLDWASYEGPESLVERPGGLLEPGEPPRGVSAVCSADLVIVPALAADGRGYRLGRGGPAVPTIALLYDGELLDEVPVAPHDQPVRAIARPGHGITRFPPGLLPSSS